jgi:hypothetical protein
MNNEIAPNDQIREYWKTKSKEYYHRNKERISQRRKNAYTPKHYINETKLKGIEQVVV